MSSQALEEFLSADNIKMLSETLGMKERLVRKFIRKWHFLSVYQESLVTRKKIASVTKELNYLNSHFIEEFGSILHRRT